MVPAIIHGNVHKNIISVLKLYVRKFDNTKRLLLIFLPISNRDV